VSIKIQTMVWDRYPGEDHELLLALKLADFCDDNGEHIFPSIETMAEKVRRSPRAVQYQIQGMVKSGWLIKVANAGGGRGRACEYRINPDWINGAEIAPISVGSKGATLAPIKRVQRAAQKGATDDAKGATGFAKGCNGLHPIHHEPPKEPSENHQPARRAPRVALHAELLNLELPDWLPFDAWDSWCEHREAKATGKDSIPWTRPAARVSLKKLEQIHSRGMSVVDAVDESVLRGWTGLWEAKDAAASGSSSAGAADGWWLEEKGWREQGARLGIDPARFQFFEQFKAKVCRTLGPGGWMEHLLAVVSRESEERGEALYAYLNDIPREKVAQQEAA
jgi:hypothetical protein